MKALLSVILLVEGGSATDGGGGVELANDKRYF